MIDAALGRKENAIREGRHACELLPVSKDAWDGPCWITNLATIYAWTGENDAALQQLENSAGNFGVTYGELKLFPIWDSLRSDPRFDQIVASLAPKDEGGRGGDRDNYRAGAPALTEKSIAVLPFENLSAEADNAFLAANRIEVPSLEKTRKEALREIFRFLRRGSLPPDESIKRSPITAANLFERLLRRSRSALRRQHDAPVSGDKGRSAVLQRLWSGVHERRVYLLGT